MTTTPSPCQVTIPGVGRCELTSHPRDGVGREIHRKGQVTWNGQEDRFFLEAAHNRWHSHLACPALEAQEAVRLLVTRIRPAVRPCALCVPHRASQPPFAPSPGSG